MRRDKRVKEAVLSPTQREAKEERKYRNGLLTDSDWTQLADAPITKAKIKEWATYRQALRDITKQPGFPFTVVYPTEPSA